MGRCPHSGRQPGITLPSLPIRVIYRSDPSGTTRAITEYFVETDPWWGDHIGAAYRLGDAGSKPWPVGQRTNGSGQLAKSVKTTPGAIGYVAPSYAQSEHLPLAILNNASGNWVSPSSSTLSEAATNTINKLDQRLRGFIVNAPGPNAYPLAIYTWMLSCPSELNLQQGQALADFLYWQSPTRRPPLLPVSLATSPSRRPYGKRRSRSSPHSRSITSGSS